MGESSRLLALWAGDDASYRGTFVRFATGTQGPIQPLIDLMRRTAEAAGRDPSRIEITTGCPGALGDDPARAVEECRARGAQRVLVPAAAFTPDPEAKLAAFGERVIRRVGGA